MKPNTNCVRTFPRNAILAVAILIATAFLSLAADPVKAGWKTYRDSERGFVLAYPPDFKLSSESQSAQKSYMPACTTDTVACLGYAGTEYKGTNFGAAAYAVNILCDRATPEDCNKIDTASSPIKPITLNGIAFHYANTSEGAMSHSISGPAYRTFHDHVCFEITLLVTSTSISVYDPGSVKEFNPAKLQQQLDKILHTFRFIAPTSNQRKAN